MKVFKSLLLPIAAITALIAGNSHAMERPYNYHHQFKEKAQKDLLIESKIVDESTKKILDSTTATDISDVDCSELPEAAQKDLKRFPRGLSRVRILKEHNLVVKQELNRIVGAHIINTCAQANNLLVQAPDKKLYYDKNNQPLVVMPKVNAIDKAYSLAQIKDLYKLSKLTGYCDFHNANIFNTAKGIAVVIDTEEKSFEESDIKTWHIRNFQKVICSLTMEPEARKWLNTKIAKLATKQTEEEIFDAIAVFDTATTLLDTCAVS